MADLVAVNGSPSRRSRTRVVAAATLDLAGGGELIDLADLDPAGLLGLAADPGVDRARDLVAGSRILIVATPVHRATYSALTKTLFDLQAPGALENTVVIPVATGHGAEHRLAIDHGLRPLVASLGGWTTPTGVYAVRGDVVDTGFLSDEVGAEVRRAVADALTLAAALADSLVGS